MKNKIVLFIIYYKKAETGLAPVLSRLELVFLLHKIFGQSSQKENFDCILKGLTKTCTWTVAL